MKASELKELNNDQLNEKLKELNLSLFNFRMTAKVGSLENPLAIRDAKRDVARIKTELRAREIQTAKEA